MQYKLITDLSRELLQLYKKSISNQLFIQTLD